MRVDGTNGDDAGLVALLQVGQCGPNRSLPRQHLDIEVGLECLIGDGLARPRVGPTGIIDQNVHAAEGGGCILDKLFHLLGVGDIGNETVGGTSTPSIQLGFCRCHLVGIAGAKRDVGPGVDKRRDRGKPQPFAATGHNGVPISKTKIHKNSSNFIGKHHQWGLAALGPAGSSLPPPQ